MKLALALILVSGVIPSTFGIKCIHCSAGLCVDVPGANVQPAPCGDAGADGGPGEDANATVCGAKSPAGGHLVLGCLTPTMAEEVKEKKCDATYGNAPCRCGAVGETSEDAAVCPFLPKGSAGGNKCETCPDAKPDCTADDTKHTKYGDKVMCTSYAKKCGALAGTGFGCVEPGVPECDGTSTNRPCEIKRVTPATPAVGKKCPTCTSCTWAVANTEEKKAPCTDEDQVCLQLSRDSFGCGTEQPPCAPQTPTFPCHGHLNPQAAGPGGGGGAESLAGRGWLLALGAALASLGVIQLLTNL